DVELIGSNLRHGRENTLTKLHPAGEDGHLARRRKCHPAVEVGGVVERTGQGYVHRAAPARMTAAAFSTARMMRLWEPQRQMFPASDCAICTREGLGFLSSSALAEIRMPARQ